MLIFDELRKNDPQLRLLAVGLAGGLLVLLAGLWWIQVVSSHDYQSALETQAYRTIRVPATRGKIFDREGRVIAENRARYNLSLYLDDLRKQFADAYKPILRQAQAAQRQAIAAQEKKLGRPLSKTERKAFALKPEQLEQMRAQARYSVANAVVSRVAQKLGQPLALDPKDFERKYNQQRALPYPVLKNLNPQQIARFEEGLTNGLGIELDLQSVRSYPLGTTASHLLGYVSQDDKSIGGEWSFFDYRLPDWSGQVGIEGGFDAHLHGQAGTESVLVNNLGYRQNETFTEKPEPGKNVVLTIDLDLQQAAEQSLRDHQGIFGTDQPRAAVVVMDIHTGDVLAMVSSPAVDPNYYVGGLAPDEFLKESDLLSDPLLRPQINRATQENYAPGSIFKPIVGLAALENGLDPNATIHNPENPEDPGHGYTRVGARSIKDTAPPGEYNFRRAIVRSSNTYFIIVGLRTGIEKIVRMAEKFHFGQGNDLPTRQETRGIFPSLERIHESNWRDGDSANICFGQGAMAVTPMQMAVAYSAIANGGRILWPRFVQRIEPADPASGEPTTYFTNGIVRENIGLSRHSLNVLYDAMLAETEDVEGTGKAAVVPGLRICGKTGTAQREDVHGRVIGWNYWFASFAPYESPRYAVVCMFQSENKGSGGYYCAPIAHDIYSAIVKKEAGRKNPVANN